MPTIVSGSCSAIRRIQLSGGFFHLPPAKHRCFRRRQMSIRSRTPSETKTRRLSIPQAFFRPRLIPVSRREARRPYHTSRRCQTLSIISAPARAPRGRPGGSFSPVPTPYSSSSALLPRRCTPPSPLPLPPAPLCPQTMWWPTAAESVSAGDTLGVFLIATFIATLYVLRMRASVSCRVCAARRRCTRLTTRRRLYGITILQTLHYFDRFYNDPRQSKLLVRP